MAGPGLNGLAAIRDSCAVNCCNGTGVIFYWNLAPDKSAAPDVGLRGGMLLLLEDLPASSTAATVYQLVPENIGERRMHRRLFWINKESLWVEVAPMRTEAALSSADVLRTIEDNRSKADAAMIVRSWDNVVARVEQPSPSSWPWLDWIVSLC